MTRSLYDNQSLTLQDAFTALRSDLIQGDGPSISTMRNYRFALLQYLPQDEFKLRCEVQRLCADLDQHGWVVLSINLQQLLLDRAREQGPEWLESVTRMERLPAKASRERGLNYLQSKLAPLIEGPDGIAADCSRIITDYVDQHPDQADRVVTLVGRAGALYPFFRSSSLLKHRDGRTRNVPVVLLYPGERSGEKGLSFMGMLTPDSDYRPRIYP